MIYVLPHMRIRALRGAQNLDHASCREVLSIL